jgi:Protein CHAPERONE-LIKE PROTEIN OF POR1-like
MSIQNHYEKLGVKENASFEEIQEAKKLLTQQHSGDSKVLESIEAAYDAIIMDRLKLRQEGKIKVPERIRFPEQSYETPSNFIPVPTNNSLAWLKKLLDRPSKTDILVSAGVYSLLATISIFYKSPQASVLPLLMALGFLANIYFLNRKENRFGRAVLITLISLLLGIGLGSGVAQLLNGSLSTVGLGLEQIACVVAFFLFWLVSSFLR